MIKSQIKTASFSNNHIYVKFGDGFDVFIDPKIIGLEMAILTVGFENTSISIVCRDGETYSIDGDTLRSSVDPIFANELCEKFWDAIK